MAFQQQFNQAYGFKINNTVVIEHPHGGNIRVSPDNEQHGDGHGGQGKFARWKVHLERNHYCKIQNEHTGKYLRIWQRGDHIDVNGGGGPFCLFKIHHLQEKNRVKLESERFPGKYVAVMKDKHLKVGQGGPHCVLTLWRQAGGQGFVKPQPQPQPQVIVAKNVNEYGAAGKFDTPYAFKANHRIVIAGPHGGHIRVKPQTNGEIDCNGGHGKWAQWDVTVHAGGLVTLKNVETGGFLRIDQHGTGMDGVGRGGKFCYFKVHNTLKNNTYKLESHAHLNKFIAINPNKTPKIGSGGKHCEISAFKASGGGNIAQNVQIQPVYNNNNNNNNGKFDAAYGFGANKRVVIQGPHGKHLRVSPQDESLVDGFGGHGNLAQWEVIHAGNQQIQIKSCKTGKYLRIHDNGTTVDCQGVGGQFTYFKYHAQGSAHVVKLQSVKFPRAYVAIPENHAVRVGAGGKHCILKFWKQGDYNNNNNNNNNNINAIGNMVQMAANAQVIAQQQKLIAQQQAELNKQMQEMNMNSQTEGYNTNNNNNYNTGSQYY